MAYPAGRDRREYSLETKLDSSDTWISYLARSSRNASSDTSSPEPERSSLNLLNASRTFEALLRVKRVVVGRVLTFPGHAGPGGIFSLSMAVGED